MLNVKKKNDKTVLDDWTIYTFVASLQEATRAFCKPYWSTWCVYANQRLLTKK